MNEKMNSNDTVIFADLKDQLKAASTDAELFQAIVNTPFNDKLKTTKLGLGVVVLLLVDKLNNTIDRIALSNTFQAQGAVQMSAKPFSEIRIPLDYDKNYIVQAVKSGEFRHTDDWQYMFIPELTPQEARFNQAGAGIDCSVIYPLTGARDGGALIFSYYEPLQNIGEAQHSFMRQYTSLVVEVLGKTD